TPATSATSTETGSSASGRITPDTSGRCARARRRISDAVTAPRSLTVTVWSPWRASAAARSGMGGEERRQFADGVKLDETVAKRFGAGRGLEFDDKPSQIERINRQLAFEERRVVGDRGRRGAFGGGN